MNEDEELERIKEEKLRKLIESKREVLSEPIDVSDSNFDEIINKHHLVVIDFWAPWCGPCYMIMPSIKNLAKKYAGKIVFGKLNVDQNQFSAVKYQTMAIPQLLIFKDGKLVDRLIGAMPEQMIEERIKRYLNG